MNFCGRQSASAQSHCLPERKRRHIDTKGKIYEDNRILKDPSAKEHLTEQEFRSCGKLVFVNS